MYNERAAKSGALSPAFTAPAEFSLDNHSPASALSELDGSLEFDGLGLGPELQFLLDQHLAESPMASDSHLLDNMDKVGQSAAWNPDQVSPRIIGSERRSQLTFDDSGLTADVEMSLYGARCCMAIASAT